MRGAAAALSLCLAAATAHARPPAPAVFCRVYPDAPACQGARPACTLCHTTASAPVTYTAYGAAVRAALRGPFEAALPAALRAVERADSDGDGAVDLDEILRGTHPGDGLSAWRAPDGEAPPRDTPWRVGAWDAAFALRRVKVAFCGQSPTWEEMQSLARAPDPRAAVHAALSACLATTWWRDEGVARLADPRVRPLGGAGTCYGYFASFEQDYDLFSYVMTGGRDARDLLRAQYHVVRDARGDLARTDAERLPAPARRGSMACRDHDGNPTRDAAGNVTALSYVGGQALAPRERAGMVTTQWFLWYNTMGSYLPRQTAAQAYRAWLGHELSHYEGLYEAPDEPRDIDRKGVAAPACASCHNTLDPIAYAFAYYWGGAGNPALYVRANVPVVYAGSYTPDRPLRFPPGRAYFDAWRAQRPVARLFGEPVGDDTPDMPALVRWARRAAESDAFARNVVEMVWELAVGRGVEPVDQRDFQALWRGMRADGYSVDRMIHRLVDTDAFGAP